MHDLPVKTALNRQTVRLITVGERAEGQRIDNFLLTQLKGLPKSHLYRLLRKGEIRINKKRVKPDYRLHIGEVLRIPPLYLSSHDERICKPNSKMQALLKSRILYEDKGLLVINKPAGMAVHGGSGINLGVIENLRHLYGKTVNLELVHRLDKDTSGCLLIAKKPSLLKELHSLLREGKVIKTYRCLVSGHWDKRKHYIDAPLLKQQLSSGERLVKVTAAGKAAYTSFKVLQYFADTTLLEVTLHTGRTHQIRVHTAFAMHPIIGDEKYGDKIFNKKIRDLGCKRLFLHAYSLALTLPSSGQVIQIKAPLDSDLQGCLDRLAKQTLFDTK